MNKEDELELQRELDRGKRLAIQLCWHLESMAGAKCDIPVIDTHGNHYKVTVECTTPHDFQTY